MNVAFRWYAFGDLNAEELYEILSLRQRVFVVEQHCAYLDADGLDLNSLHLCARGPEGNLAGYLRLLPPGARYPGPAIGRVLIAPEVRRAGFGRMLMQEGIHRSSMLYPADPLTVCAQMYLERFYLSLGFSRSGAPSDEGGILHIVMVRPATVR
jgi:ElaA protein